MAFYCVTKTQVDPASNLSQAGFFFVLCFPSLSRLPVLSKSFDCLQCLPAVGALPLLTQFRREGWSVHYWFPDRPAPSFTLFFFLSAFSLDRSAPSLFVSSLPPNWERRGIFCPSSLKTTREGCVWCTSSVLKARALQPRHNRTKCTVRLCCCGAIKS